MPALISRAAETGYRWQLRGGTLAGQHGHVTPKPVVWFWDWQIRARCRAMDTELFFPQDPEPRPDRIRRERKAKEVCIDCPVLRECRNYALAAGEVYGVWGGTSESERRTMHRTEIRIDRVKAPLRFAERYRHAGPVRG
ncbi:WhiB family transcriptional regulator [Rhodococcus sp. NPDC057529]|uniref:WhiB family transcriptional regulator n=1 Tax=Rhodococcus sp. NPDC057529 TaxID=3346158 RepID=UPI00366B6F6F